MTGSGHQGPHVIVEGASISATELQSQPKQHPGVSMPPLRSMFGKISIQVIESTVVPAAIFYGMLQLTGLLWALFSGLAWCYLMIARRWVSGGALPAVLIVGALLFTTRTGIALAFHSAFLYLLTPTVNAFALAAVFLGSVLARRPLTERFARDFVGLPKDVTATVRMQSVFRKLSLVWAAVNVINGGVALQLLAAKHYGEVLVVRSLLAPVLTAFAVGCCIYMGRKALRAEGVHIHLRWRDATPV